MQCYYMFGERAHLVNVLSAEGRRVLHGAVDKSVAAKEVGRREGTPRKGALLDCIKARREILQPSCTGL